jgi:CRP-like cAMP-binding protein
MPNAAFIPVIESRLEDEDPFVRQVAEFASERSSTKETNMPEIIDSINRLKTFSLFEGLGTRELHAIATVTKIEGFQPGDVLIRAAEENQSIYLVVSGKITIYSNYETPEQKEVRTVSDRGFLNFAPMFTGLPPINTSVVREATEALVLPQSQFHEIMRVYPHIAVNLLRIAALMLRELGVTP